MSLLREHPWRRRYDTDATRLVSDFYEPALACAVRYDRTTGYFNSRALTLAARGLEELLRNRGRVRLVVGCTLEQAEVEAIERGQRLRDALEAHLLAMPLNPRNPEETNALELVAWMVANGHLEVKVALPCDSGRRPLAGSPVFHSKSGIVEDKTGDRIAFVGSVNETEQGWSYNWESFHVFKGYEGPDEAERVAEEDAVFARLWADQFDRCLVLSVPAAVRADLLRFLPSERPPARLADIEVESAPLPDPRKVTAGPLMSELVTSTSPDLAELRRLVWGIIENGPALNGPGERVGEATSVVIPWPHQVRAFLRLYASWPPRLLIADEVGLGKTIEAGLLLRQAWLAGRARRILILAPHAVLSQWQIELREKFNLHWPIYDGQRLRWCASHADDDPREREVTRRDWHREPCVITSSQLMRRTERAAELLESAEPWDLVVLDEAHHARRRGASLGGEYRPNHLLRLMLGLVPRTQGLILLTATPMQVDPVEVWDLLQLLGLPVEWTESAFRSFFESAAKPNPSHEEFERMATLFRSSEAEYGALSEVEAKRAWREANGLGLRRVLSALRDEAQTPRRQLSLDRRSAAVRLMRAASPVARLISRHTRELLRQYYRAGKISTPIADRDVADRFVPLSHDERQVYDAVEEYIATTYDAANPSERNAIGFVMTIYRRRLASSFAALRNTLADRFALLTGESTSLRGLDDDAPDEDLDELPDEEDLSDLERAALRGEERASIERLLADVKRLPIDTKAGELLHQLRALREAGYAQVMVFTQYTDTMDFLRDLVRQEGFRVLCFSGRGGETPQPSGGWRLVSRDDVKRVFREGAADVLLCTDAAAEGLNFQFCGALINYDMPWNPMRVEQRIGRIDRLGQQHPRIRIVNLHYDDTVETDVYRALRERIGLFSTYVGKLQPILSSLPRAIGDLVLSKGDKESQRHDLVESLRADIAGAQASSFDLDEVAASDLEEPARPAALYDLSALDHVLKQPQLLPPGFGAKPVGDGEYRWSAPGGAREVRVTTNAEFFEQHAGSCELFSPGSPIFPEYEGAASFDEVKESGLKLDEVLRIAAAQLR